MSSDDGTYGSGATIEKLDAMQRYADAYTTALKDAPKRSVDKFSLHYVDAFAGRGNVRLGAGIGAGDIVPGSAMRALDVTDRPFDRLLFIESDEGNCDALRQLISERGETSRVTVRRRNANDALSEYCEWLGHDAQRMVRSFVFVDAFAMQADWNTIAAIAATKRVDLLMLFPLMALRRNLKIDGWPHATHVTALNRFYGDDSWRELYTRSGDRIIRQGGDREIVASYARRLSEIFVEVVDPERTLGSADDGSLFTMLFGASNQAGAKVAAPIAEGVFTAATGVQGRMRI